MIGFTRMADVEGMTMGRFVNVWGAMGVMSSASTLGATIGPPAARLYAVDPVGVAMISPSALTRVTRPSPTETDKSISRERAPLLMTTSFNAISLVDEAG